MSKHDEGNLNEENQADNLMKLFQEVANHNPDDDGVEQASTDLVKYDVGSDETSYVELDILNLPPRREVHERSRVRYSFSLKKPFTRLIFVMILVVMVITLLFYFNLIQEPLSFFYFIESSHIMEIQYSMENQKMI